MSKHRRNTAQEKRSDTVALGSYHAIVACVAAGSGIAIVPRSVLAVVHAENEVSVYPLPARIARTKTLLVWRQGHRSIALDAMRSELGRIKRS